jgi:hypothetical protein
MRINVGRIATDVHFFLGDVQEGNLDLTVVIDADIFQGNFGPNQTSAFSVSGLDPTVPHNLSVFPGFNNRPNPLFSLDYMIFTTPDNLYVIESPVLSQARLIEGAIFPALPQYGTR